ncbi:TRIO and F-actin-binding protein Tara Trio-associated repeat on actin [Channa argus]|uniref:TRIO and F-actin-binding protein Tara Trio-associated repeat on actin n=1 Tax=Channa argus TaxID=215402 RepID=A0A6G1QCY0_CHAAH|nr:TRIO and F-actin-binding protein Tara Trio-associated repeat on actin [Channa argus]
MKNSKKHNNVCKKAKIKPGSKKRENKCIVMFDDKDRQEYLTGFHKRKVERRKAAVAEIQKKIREEQIRVREERHKEYVKMLKERKEALNEAEDDLEDLITSTTESVQYDHPNHTVTVTTISDLDLTGAHLLGPSADQTGGDIEDEEKGEKEEEKINAMPRKAGNPITNKKIRSLTAALSTCTSKRKRKGKQEGRGGRGRNTDRRAGVTENKKKSGRTSKWQRRRQTGKKFQPNIFDPSRCHDCLRQRHLHAGAGGSTEVAPQQKSTADAGTGALPGSRPGITLLTPILSQAEERDTSSKEDSDGLSLVSSHCGVSSLLGYGEDSLCILSPDCDLFICDGDDDDDTDSCRDHQEFSGSVSAEDEYLPNNRHRSTAVGMTRLDPPPHRPNPRTWMDDNRSRDGFSRQSGLKGDREKRESGYFSLGRAAGARSHRDNSPPVPYRHFERGHPIFSNRSVEPKDAIPFRNPNLGMASERQVPDNLLGDLPVEVPPPDPYEIAVEVEAQVGPRSPSPTPFKIAESLASTGRKGFSSSYSRGNSSSQVSVHQHSGRFDPSRQGKALQSRPSSPSHGNLPFRRSESTVSLSRHNLEGGGWSQETGPRPRTSFQGAHARQAESGTLPSNFKSFASSVKSQSSTISDFRSALRKTGASRSLNARDHDSRSSSPSRRGYNPPGQTGLGKTEFSSSLSHGSGRDSRTSSPSRRTSDRLRDSSSPPRRNFSLSSQSLLRKSESVSSLNGRSHHGRCGSPIREGYDIESQALLRNSTSRNGLDDQGYKHESPIMSPPKQSYDAPNRSILRKTASSPVGSSQGRDSRSSSPGRRGYEKPSQYQVRKTDTSGSFNSRSFQNRNLSPTRRNYEGPSQSPLRKSEVNSSIRSHDSVLPTRKSYDAPDQRSQRKTEARSSVNSRNSNSQNSPPYRKGNRSPPGCSLLRKDTSGDSARYSQIKNANNNSAIDSKHSPRSWRESAHSRRSSSLSRGAAPTRQYTNGSRTPGSETPRSPSSMRHGVGRHVSDDHYPSPSEKRPSHRAQSPSYLPQVQMGKHTSSQSSMESTESGQLSVGSAGRNREEYALMADLPKVKIIHQMEVPGHTVRPQNQQSSRRQELFKPASHSLSKQPREWDDTVDTEREWHYGGGGYLSRAHSSTSLQPDLLNFKKGWMSKLDESGEWKKHWFVLTDAGLKYYRDSSAEEKDDMDGEIDLKSCVRVSEFDVEKNYGFQIEPASQREAGEGQGKQHSRWQEEKNPSSHWEALVSRKSTTIASNQRLCMEEEIEKKWTEFERLPLKDMTSVPPVGSQPSSQSACEALQREVASLRQQLEELKRRGGRSGGVVQGGCGPEAPCGRSLLAMERAHRHALEELQRQHDRRMKELEAEKARLLQEEAQDTARVMEALKKKHKEELEREVEKVKRLSSGALDPHTLRSQQQAEVQSLQRELAGLSERYSQKCLELNRAEQNNAEREREISRKERDMEQLKKDNQELKTRLSEEIGRMRSAITDPGSGDRDGTPCELEVLLRVKENEIEYLHKEISCLRNEVEFLNTEKRLACERHAEVTEELSGIKSRSEREIQSLKEHLRLAMAALQEGQKLGNSLDH